MKAGEIEAETVLIRSKLPDADYVVNPYTGCELGCQYCYASFTGRFVGEPVNNWGRYVYAKVNAVSLFRAELERIRRAGRAPSILLSSVTDAYQGVEKKYRLTRGILGVVAEEPYPGVVSILTKSPLVLRDVDILRRIPRAEVGLTTTTTDDRLSRFLEVRAPLASRRLRTLAELHAAGLNTYAFVGPLLPHLRYHREALESLFARVADAGVGSVFIEHINLRPYIKQRLWQILKSEPPAIQQVYERAVTEEHRHALDAMINQLLEKYGLNLRLNQVLYHNSQREHRH